MDILTVLYALVGIGILLFLSGSGIGRIFRNEMSDDEFCKMYKEWEDKRNAARSGHQLKDKENAQISYTPVKVELNESHSLYLASVYRADGMKIRRYSDYNTIFDFYKTDKGYCSTIENQRIGQRKRLEAARIDDMIRKIESCFLEWSFQDSGRNFSYTLS